MAGFGNPAIVIATDPAAISIVRGARQDFLPMIPEISDASTAAKV